MQTFASQSQSSRSRAVANQVKPTAQLKSKPTVQMMGMEEEEMVQGKFETEPAQRMGKEEEMM
ncbi:MAG: hypothetical protein AAF135_00180 [Bacteroidota bacterium]